MKKLCVALCLLTLLSACSKRVEFDEPEIEEVAMEEEFVLGAEESMDGEYVYFDDIEIKDPVIFEMTVEDGTLTPSEFRAKKGDYVLLRIMNLSDEHAIVIPEYGWRTILHEDQETEFGFRARTRGTFPFYCSSYCTQRSNHLRGTIIVE